MAKPWGPLPDPSPHATASWQHPQPGPSTAPAPWLHASGLPARWQGLAAHQVLDTHFDHGHKFLATWAAWRADARRCGQLVYLALHPAPPSRAQLAQALASQGATQAATPGWHACASPVDPALAQQLLQAWPARTPDLHLLTLDGGAVRLLLAWGQPGAVLADLVAAVDTLYLCGPHAVDLVPGLGRLAAANATLVACLAPPDATSQAADTRVETGAVGLATALQRAGFVPDAATAASPWLQARFAPRHTPRRPLGQQATPGVRQVAVVGAGLAGAAAARALAAQGVQVRVYDRLAGAAQATSGNAAGLYHGTVHASDGPHARWLRAAALLTQRLVQPLVHRGQLDGQADGLLRGESKLGLAQMQALLRSSGLPPEYLQVLADAWPTLAAAQAVDTAADNPAPTDARNATHGPGDPVGPARPEGPESRRPPGAGAPGRPAWFYPGGGWLAPAQLVRHWLDHATITLHPQQAVQRLARDGQAWQLLDEDGRPLCRVDAVVLANADDAVRLLLSALAGPTDALPAQGPTQTSGQAPGAWPLWRQRGQTTLVSPPVPPHPLDTTADTTAGACPPGWPRLPLPLAAGGYALQLPDGRLLCGATGQADDNDPALRQADHVHNLATLARLCGYRHPDLGQGLDGRVGWRLLADDRLPVVGPVPGAALQTLRLTQPRHHPRVPGLWLLTALGSRGITQAALAGELLAAWMLGRPWPVAASLADAVDPARFAARALRQADRSAGRAPGAPKA